MWDPNQYSRFSDERSQPFYDLLSRVRLEAPRRIADLGCGPGNLTAVLAQRWPGAQVHGIDNSPEMLEAAAPLAQSGRLSFELADLAEWSPAEPFDLILANASIHWVPDHEILLPKLANALAPGGVLAFQQPGNFEAPSHRLLQTLCGSPRWAARLADQAKRKSPVQPPAWYLSYLLELGMSAVAWETIYYHVLRGEDPVLEWTAGTALRPVFAALDAEERAEFRGQYAAALREAYPPQDFGTIFPFRRIFVVARKS